MKILVSDQLHEAGIEMLKEVGDVEYRTGMSTEELKEAIKDKDALVVRSATKATREVIEAATNLKVIGRAGIGVDNIDLDAATKRGIVVVNAPSASTVTVSELTLGFMIALARNLTRADSSLKADKWEKKKLLGVELSGKTLGVIGTGRIGSEVIKKARGIGMKVIGYDPYVTQKAAKEMGFELVDLDGLYANADFITLHIPKTEQTYHMINQEAISKMKQGVFIVNCARGGTIDEKDLLEGLESGKIGGAALDVFEVEPPTGNPLLKNERFIATPHIGASTEEAQRGASTIVCEEVIKVLRNEPATNVVNMPRVLPEVLEGLKDFLVLGETLGSFAIQLTRGRVQEVSVTYCGYLVESKGLEVLTSAILKGILSPILTGGVNLMNASAIAKTRGIIVSEGKRDDSDKWDNLVILKVKFNGREREIMGALFGGEEPRIVGIDRFRMDFIPSGNLLVIEHDDRPGMIGKIATRLGDHGVNIGSMYVGRSTGCQLMVSGVDQKIDKDVLSDMEKIEGISEITRVKV